MDIALLPAYRNQGIGSRLLHALLEKAKAFSLIFQGAPDVFLEQKTYALSHPKMGAFDLFLVPIAQNEEGYAYQAVFN